MGSFACFSFFREHLRAGICRVIGRLSPSLAQVSIEVVRYPKVQAGQALELVCFAARLPFRAIDRHIQRIAVVELLPTRTGASMKR